MYGVGGGFGVGFRAWMLSRMRDVVRSVAWNYGMMGEESAANCGTLLHFALHGSLLVCLVVGRLVCGAGKATIRSA